MLNYFDVLNWQKELPAAIAAYLVHGDAETGTKIFDIGDKLSQELVGCGINDLIEKWTDHRYRPTLNAASGMPYQLLADVYDTIATARGMDVRAYRGARSSLVAFQRMVDALNVITKDKCINAWLSKNDPKALRQAVDALAGSDAVILG